MLLSLHQSRPLSGRRHEPTHKVRDRFGIRCTMSALERIGASTIWTLLKFIGRRSDGQRRSRL